MTDFWDSNHRPFPLSVTLAALIAFWYMSALGGVTVLTHLAQILSLPFRIYAYLSLGGVVVISVAVLATGGRMLVESRPRDIYHLPAILLIGLVGTFLAVSFHRVGRISPDEYYYAANPVYYIQHPDAKMGFETHTFYSRDPAKSASYFTAGAYEYAQASLAYLFDIQFAKIYYVFAAGLTGFLIPVSIFLMVYCFCSDVPGSVLGTFVAICAITLMGETSWAPGANSFLRSFEGKAYLLFAGIPLFTTFSLAYFVKPSIISWLNIFALCTALAGITSSSFGILPILGIILFSSYWISSGENVTSSKRFAVRSAAYFAAFFYLAVVASFVAYYDGVRSAVLFNKDYPSTFVGYLAGFIYPPLPVTPMLTVVVSIVAVVVLKGRSRAVLSLWMILTLALVLNPLSAQLLLKFFRGIYYRFFYIFPFPASAGIMISSLYSLTRESGPLRRIIFVSVTCLISMMSAILLPVSIFRAPIYAWGNSLGDPDFLRAKEVVSILPKGVMLAPYPLSGAISMLDSDYPQVLTRTDILDFYLGLQGREEDAALRDRVQMLVDGDSDDTQAMVDLLGLYPEITSVVMNKQAYLRNEGAIKRALEGRGFVRNKVFISGIVVFSK